MLGLQGTGGSSVASHTPRQQTYMVGSQSQVPRSSSKSPGGGGIPDSGVGDLPPTPNKDLSPLIDFDVEEAQRYEIEGMGSGRGAPGPSGGGREPFSSIRMRIDFRNQPRLEPPILKDDVTRFNGLMDLLVTN